MKQHKRKHRHRTSIQMYGHIAAWEKSGQPQREYLLEHGISKSVFGYWLRKYRQDQQFKSGSFLAVSAPAGAIPTPLGFASFRLSNGSELILHEAVSAGYLRELLGW